MVVVEYLGEIFGVWFETGYQGRMDLSGGQALDPVIVVALSLHTFKQERVLAIKFLVENSHLSHFLVGVDIEEEGVGRVFGHSCV